LQAADVRGMLQRALDALQQARTLVDALNVFPVPDGDTGTNMALTLQAAWQEARQVQDAHAGRILRAFAAGAIRGARGNSGVILSQILRGMADAVGDLPAWQAEDLARAFRLGQERAYKGVMEPVEGTILTIIRSMAEASLQAVAHSDDVAYLLETSLDKAKAALAQTPEMLPVLKRAGVVDAGGQGLVYILAGMTSHLTGKNITITPPQIPADLPHMAEDGQEDEWGYDIQYLIHQARKSEDEIRHELIDLGGESIVVGRSGGITKVHVHGPDPGPFLSYGASLGHLEDIVVENMTLQTLRRRGEWPEDAGPDDDFSIPTDGEHCLGVVAVAPSQGFAQIFSSLGACHVVRGGQTMNPSTQDLLQAVAGVAESEVILLSNNKNIILAARQAAELADKKVYVVETHSLPQGVAAMFAFNPALSLAENARQMQAQAQQVRTIQVTTAVRDADVDGVAVRQGEAIALVDGKLCCAESSPQAAALKAIAGLGEDELDVVTIYFGQPATPEQALDLAEALVAAYPDVEVEAVAGGQPHYHYIISVE